MPAFCIAGVLGGFLRRQDQRWALGKTVRLRFRRRNLLFRLLMALAAYMTFRAVWENLNMGLMQS